MWLNHMALSIPRFSALVQRMWRSIRSGGAHLYRPVHAMRRTKWRLIALVTTNPVWPDAKLSKSFRDSRAAPNKIHLHFPVRVVEHFHSSISSPSCLSRPELRTYACQKSAFQFTLLIPVRIDVRRKDIASETTPKQFSPTPNTFSSSL